MNIFINGRGALSANDIGELIRNQAGKQVRLAVKRGSSVRDVIVTPIESSFNLRYRDWEYGNRKYVDQKSQNTIFSVFGLSSKLQTNGFSVSW